MSEKEKVELYKDLKSFGLSRDNGIKKHLACEKELSL